MKFWSLVQKIWEGFKQQTTTNRLHDQVHLIVTDENFSSGTKITPPPRHFHSGHVTTTELKNAFEWMNKNAFMGRKNRQVSYPYVNAILKRGRLKKKLAFIYAKIHQIVCGQALKEVIKLVTIRTVVILSTTE